MKIAILSPIAWRTPPRKYGPWEQVVSTITEGLAQRGLDVTLYATGDSLTSATLRSVCPTPYAENPDLDAKVWECLHISHLMEHAHEYDIIHNHYDFLPLTYSRLINAPMVTTIHGFSSSRIHAVYEKYNNTVAYISISDADRLPTLDYVRTIYHGIDHQTFKFESKKENYLLYFGRIHPEKGAHMAIEIAKESNHTLKIAGLIQDQDYFDQLVAPKIDGRQVLYLGNAGPELRNELLGKARALLHPISFDEPFGLSVAEAMMCGTPVIAFARGSMPELIVDGITGYIVSNTDEATVAVKNLDQINPQACRDHARSKFSTERMIDEYINVYEWVIANRIRSFNRAS